MQIYKMYLYLHQNIKLIRSTIRRVAARLQQSFIIFFGNIIIYIIHDIYVMTSSGHFNNCIFVNYATRTGRFEFFVLCDAKSFASYQFEMYSGQEN